MESDGYKIMPRCLKIKYWLFRCFSTNKLKNVIYLRIMNTIQKLFYKCLIILPLNFNLFCLLNLKQKVPIIL